MGVVLETKEMIGQTSSFLVTESTKKKTGVSKLYRTLFGYLWLSESNNNIIKIVLR